MKLILAEHPRILIHLNFFCKIFDNALSFLRQSRPSDFTVSYLVTSKAVYNDLFKRLEPRLQSSLELEVIIQRSLVLCYVLKLCVVSAYILKDGGYYTFNDGNLFLKAQCYFLNEILYSFCKIIKALSKSFSPL